MNEAEWDRHANSLLATGVVFVILHNAPGVTEVDIDMGDDQGTTVVVGFDFLKSKYRVTVEQIVDGETD